MTVAQLRRDMSHDEWVRWFAWHTKRAQEQEVEQKMAERRGARRGK